MMTLQAALYARNGPTVLSAWLQYQKTAGPPRREQIGVFFPEIVDYI
jgi:hypothetical protein